MGRPTGNTRKTDELGRIVLPAEIRRNFRLNIKDDIEIFTENDVIVLRKYEAACIFCGSSNDVTPFKEKFVCPVCAKELKREI